MRLQNYLDRIQYHGELMPTLDVLKAIHVSHVCSIPFENIDVQLGHHLTISINDAYHKIVERQRGGWCYEQNGLFGWALTEIGFDVTRLAANVVSNTDNTQRAANHLCLLVDCPGQSQVQYLADVGFGGSMLRPLRLANHACSQLPFELSLRQLDDGHWHFRENMNGTDFGFDFLPVPANEQALMDMSDHLQSHSNSNFVQNLVAQRRASDKHTILRGRVLTRIRKNAVETEVLHSSDALVKALLHEFGLDLPEVADLWPRIVARHNQLFS